MDYLFRTFLSWKSMNARKSTRWEIELTIFPRVFCLVRKCPVQCPFDEMLMPGHDGLVVCRPKTILRIGDPKCRWKNGNIHRVRLLDTFYALRNRNRGYSDPCLLTHVWKYWIHLNFHAKNIFLARKFKSKIPNMWIWILALKI